MHSVADVLRPDFTRSWHEAVAIVQAAATQLTPGLALPGPGDLHLDENGILAFGFASESSDDPVIALARLLNDLLEGVEAPGSLRELAAENARSAAHATVDSFSQALAFFERPNRVNDIRAVVSRLRASRSRSTLDEEFDRLREKVSASERAEDDQQKKKKPRDPRLSKAQQILAIAVLVVVVFGSLALRSGVHRGFGSAVDKAEGGIQQVVSMALDQLGLSKAASTAEAASAAASEPVEKPSNEPRSSNATPRSKPAQRTADRSATGTERGGQPRIPERAGSGLQVLPSPSSLGRPASDQARTVTPPATLAIAPSADPAASAGPIAPHPLPRVHPEIFSSADPEVQAPVLVRPQLPDEPAPGSDTGYFDLVVDENGDVSHVKLTSPRRKYYDRMLVAAAKAWKFRPATLNGQPVKYRLRVPIIMAGMPGR